MYVYIKTEPGMWTVGFYAPITLPVEGHEWHAESDHDSEEAAAKRVHWLNGGNS